MGGTWRADVTAKRPGFLRRHRVATWIGGASLLTLAGLVGAGLILARRAEPLLRARIVEGLENHFHARVELDSFHVRLENGLWAEGKGLRIWPPAGGGYTEELDAERPVTPLIRLAEFRFHAPLHYKPGMAIRITAVKLRGLNIDIPPRQQLTHRLEQRQSNTPGGNTYAGMGPLRFHVEDVECNGASVTLEASKPGKLPLMFAIAHLKLTKVGEGGAMGFEAELTNPKPVGIIHTQGDFGPWNVEDPGESPIAGNYSFQNADLSGFKGIAGTLDSTGSYRGSLRNMEVEGETVTPDFRLTRFGTPLGLHTRFHARVDGTNGDTQLEPVEATLGASHLWARGEIVRVKPEAGATQRPGEHSITLTINIDRGRIEDFLRLASRSGSPLLTGALTMKAQLEVPPGPVPVDERLKVNGTFSLDDAQFTADKIQGKIAELSARGQGKPNEANKDSDTNVRSTMKGRFVLADRVVTVPSMEYTVPGATIDIVGKYGMDGGTLNFAGNAKMQATISAMVGGWKGFLLKPVDRYFQKDGSGTEIPIHITGTRESPQFGIDFNRMKGTRAERPGDSQQ